MSPTAAAPTFRVGDHFARNEPVVRRIYDRLLAAARAIGDSPDDVDPELKRWLAAAYAMAG